MRLIAGGEAKYSEMSHVAEEKVCAAQFHNSEAGGHIIIPGNPRVNMLALRHYKKGLNSGWRMQRERVDL